MVRRSFLPALAPALAAATGLLLAAPAPPASATATAPDPGPARYDPAIEVTIDSMTPSYLPEEGPVRVTGSVTNVDEVPWTTVNLYPFLDDSPMTTAEELETAAASDPLLAVGERITVESASDSVGDLEPGETARYSIAVDRDLLATNGDGVYWFGVHAMGQSAEQPRDDVADGRARTFLPLRTAATRGTVKTALVLPLRRYLAHAPDGSLGQLDNLTRTLSKDGRSRSLVDFAASAGALPLTLLVDPALPDAVRRLAQGNPPRSIGATDTGSGQGDDDSPDGATEDPETEAPADGTGDGTGDDTGDDTASDRQSRLGEAAQETADAASAWLGRFAEASGGSELLTLPYGDVDVPAAAATDPSVYDLARGRPGRVLSELVGSEGSLASGPSSDAPPAAVLPAVAAPSGYLDAGGFDLVEPGTTVLLTDKAFDGSAPGVARVEGRRVVVTSSGAARGGPGPGNRFTTLQLRQRILSEALLRLLTPGRRPLVVVMPSQWRPSDASAFFSGLDVDWLSLTTVDDAADRAGRTVSAEDLAYPAVQRRRQLEPASFAAFDDLVAAGATLQNLLTSNVGVAAEVTDQALTGLSYGAREAPLASRFEMRRSTSDLQDQLAKVSIDAGPGVTLSGTDGGFAAVISNDLDEAVTVGIVATSSDGGIEIAPVEPVEVAAGSRATVVLDAHANLSGVSNVVLTLTDLEGNALGATDQLPIRSAQVSAVIWLILGTGLGLLFLAIVVRLARRVRRAAGARRHAEGPVAPPEAPADPRPTPLDAGTAPR